MYKLGFFSGFLVLIVAFAGCEPSQQVELSEEDLATLVPYASLGRGLQASLDTTVTRVITDRSDWRAHMDSLQPLQPFTTVDFDIASVILAAVAVNSGGYDLRFELVESLRDTVVATYRLFAPGTDCRPSFAPGIPFEAIRVPRTLDPVRFVQVDEQLDCTPS